MSIHGKRPFAERVIGGLPSGWAARVLTETDASGKKPTYSYAGGVLPPAETVAACHFELGGGRAENGVLVAHGGTEALFAFGHGEAMMQYRLSTADRSWERINEPLTVSEFRRIAHDAAGGSSAAVTADGLHAVLEGSEFITADLNEDGTAVTVSVDSDYRPYVIELDGTTGGTVPEDDYARICGPAASYVATLMLDGWFYRRSEEADSYDVYSGAAGSIRITHADRSWAFEPSSRSVYAGDEFVDVRADGGAYAVSLTREYAPNVVMPEDTEENEGTFDDGQFSYVGGEYASYLTRIRLNGDHYLLAHEGDSADEYASLTSDGAYVLTVGKDPSEEGYMTWVKKRIPVGTQLYLHRLAEGTYGGISFVATTADPQDIEDDGDVALLADYLNDDPGVLSVVADVSSRTVRRVLFVLASGHILTAHLADGTDISVVLEPAITDGVTAL